MEHEATSGVSQQRGSAMGAHRHTSRELAARIAAAIQQRLTLVVEVAEQVLHTTRTAQRAGWLWEARLMTLPTAPR